MTKHRHRIYASFPEKGVSESSILEADAHIPFPNSVTLQTSKTAVLKLAHAHKEDEAYTIDKKMGSARIIKLDDLTAYDVSENEESMLWEIEVDRLLHAVNNTGVSANVADEAAFAQSTTEVAFDELSGLADQLLINMHVCRVDNGSVLYDLSNKNYSTDEYANSVQILRKRQEENASTDKTTATAAAAAATTLSAADGTKHNAVRSGAGIASYCALVDTATVVCCRIAIAAFEDKDWHGLVVSSLAKYSAKLKVLAMDPNKFTQRSINMASRSKQYKAMLDGIGSTLRTMQKQSKEWNFLNKRGGKKKKKKKEESSDEEPSSDEDDDDELGGKGLRLGNEYDYVRYAPHMQQFGGGLNRGMRPGMGMGMGMGGGHLGGPGMVPWATPLYSEKRLKELEAFTTKKKEVDEGKRYFSYMSLINNWTSSTLLHILQELKTSFVSDLPSDGFDLCSVVYEAGTVDCTVPVLLHQDRGAELSGSNKLHLIQYSYMGFWLAQQTAATFKGGSCNTSSSPAGRPLATFRVEIQHNGEVERSEPTDVRLQNMSQTVAVMLPLLCTSPFFADILKASIFELRELFSIDIQEHLLPKAPRFVGIVSLRTHAFETSSPGCLPQSDFRSLSWSILAEPDRHSTLALKHTTTQSWAKTPPQQRAQQVRDVKTRQLQLAKDASDWVFEEGAIRVNCARYVYIVVAVCATLAVGGLVLGIFLGTFVREGIALQGVDPFGFTTYAWVIAAFIMLIAKSVRVVEWPWRDFLLRRVTCRTLSELHSVTGVDEQDLLTYLITMEYENVLITTGPYNSIFNRRNNSHGFSIDCKPELRALLAAGLIFVKVLVGKEPALVSLDLRAGATKRSRQNIRHRGGLTSNDVYCRYPPMDGDRVQDVVLYQQQRHWDHVELLNWDKVLGIYHDWDRMVR